MDLTVSADKQTCECVVSNRDVKDPKQLLVFDEKAPNLEVNNANTFSFADILLLIRKTNEEFQTYWFPERTCQDWFNMFSPKLGFSSAPNTWEKFRFALPKLISTSFNLGVAETTVQAEGLSDNVQV